MLRKIPCTPSFFVYLETHSAVSSHLGQARVRPRRADPLDELGPLSVSLPSRNPSRRR